MTDQPQYSSWLVASDIDGTLNDKRHKLPQRNLKAIADFVEKGGKFTLSSDRNAESMKRYYDKLPLNGIPAVITNGAGIYDYVNEKMLYFSELNESSMDKAIEIAKKYPTIDTMVFTADTLYRTGIGFWTIFYVIIDRLSYKLCRDIKKVPRGGWGKVVFSGPPWRVRQLKKELKKTTNRGFDIISTSFVSVGILARGTNKGTAVLKLAEMLGIDESHTAAVGDYYNDFEMLTQVAVAGCTAQAPDALKAISEHVTCHCNDGAVADFLDFVVENKIEN